MIIKFVVSINRKWNILEKLITPRVELSVRYIISELEEIEREDNYRLKRFKELKSRRNENYVIETTCHCYCDEIPGKGDYFVCSVCKEEKEKIKKSRTNSYYVRSKSYISEFVGNKFSMLRTINQKHLDLTTHLKIILSLTNQRNMEGVLSPIAQTFVYTCREIKCPVKENDEPQDSYNTSGMQTFQCKSCDICDDEEEDQHAEICCDTNGVLATQVERSNVCKDTKQEVSHDNVYCTVSNESLNLQDQCISSKCSTYNLKVLNTEYISDIINKEKQVLIKRNNQYKSNKFSGYPFLEKYSFDNGSGFNLTHENCNIFYKDIGTVKSHEISSCIREEQTKLRLYVSDTRYEIKDAYNTIKHGCMLYYTAINPKTSSLLSNNLFPSKWSSLTENSQSDIDEKMSRSVCCNIESFSETEINSFEITEKLSKNVGCNEEFPAQTGSSNSKILGKSSKNSILSLNNKTSMKDESCAYTAPMKSILCNTIWKDECCSAIDLVKNSAGTNKKITFIHNTDKDESKSKAEELCCDLKDDIMKNKKSSVTFIFKLCNKSEEFDKCPRLNTKSENTSSFGECNYCIAKNEVSSKSNECSYCTEKSYGESSSCNKLSHEHCSQCTAISEVKPNPGKCSHCAIRCENKKSEVRLSSEKGQHYLARKKSKDNEVNTKSEKCINCGRKNNIEQRCEKCRHCAAQSEAKPASGNCAAENANVTDNVKDSSKKCSHCVTKRIVKPNPEKCPECKAESVNKKGEIRSTTKKCPYCVARNENYEVKTYLGKCSCDATEITPKHRKCPQCAARTEITPCSDKSLQCVAHSDSDKYKMRESSGKYSHYAAKSKHETGEVKPSSEKCSDCAAESENKNQEVRSSSSRKCPHCAVKNELKQSSGQCSCCTAKSEIKLNPRKCSQCARNENENSEVRPSSRKCQHFVPESENRKEHVKTSSGKCLHCVDKNEKKTRFGNCSHCGAKFEVRPKSSEFQQYPAENKNKNGEKSDSSGKCSQRATKTEMKPSFSKCPHHKQKQETKDKDEKKPLMFCKIRIVSKENIGSEGNRETVKEFIFLGNLLDAIKEVLETSKSENIEKKLSCTDGTGPVRKTTSCPRTILKKPCPLHEQKNDKDSVGKQKVSEDPSCSVQKTKLSCNSHAEVTKKNASTLTRRSDRYDVRPLKLMKSNKKRICTCHSDSFLLRSNRLSNPKRCKSCLPYQNF